MLHYFNANQFLEESFQQFIAAIGLANKILPFMPPFTMLRATTAS